MNVKVFAVSEKSSVQIHPHYSLYPYQRQVFTDIVSNLSSSGRRVVAHLPTGSGKTRIATHVACHFLNNSTIQDSIAIWLASSEELCDQAAVQLGQGWSNLGLRDVYMNRFWGKSTLDFASIKSGFLVTGLAKLHAAARNQVLLSRIAPRVCLIIFDEAHQAIARTYEFITEQLCTYDPPLLGLTATPGRTANVTDSDHQLASMFNRKKVSIDPRGHDSSVTYLIENGFLANPRFTPFEHESRVRVAEPKSERDYSERDLKRIGDESDRTELIVKLTKRATERHKKIIVFCPSVESVIKCQQLLQLDGVTASAITAKTPNDIRRNTLESFRSDNGNIKVVLNYGVLTAGFDAPQTSCVIVARPTNSLVLYSQMVGRALRGPRAGGNRRAEIITVVDTNLPGFGSVTEAFQRWEEIWSSS